VNALLSAKEKRGRTSKGRIENPTWLAGAFFGVPCRKKKDKFDAPT
jgi:hypothetical protein